jgi:hypothetical protein
MTKIPDDIPLDELVRRAAQALTRAGMQHRIDIYRDVEVDDPAVRMMLGRTHKVRVRVKITAASLLFEPNGAPVESPLNGASDTTPLNGSASAPTTMNGNSHGDIHPFADEHVTLRLPV